MESMPASIAVRTSRRPAGARRGDRLVKRLEDPRFPDLRVDAVPVQIGAQIPRHAREDDANLPACEFAEQVADDASGRIVDVGHRAGVQDKPPNRRGRAVDEGAHFVGEAVGVGVEKVRAEPVDDESRFGLQTRRGRRWLPPARRVRDEHPRVGPIAVADVLEKRKGDREKNALLDTDRRYGGGRARAARAAAGAASYHNPDMQ